MATYPPAIARLLDELTRLPGVGPKTAERYVFSLLRQSPQRLKDLADAITQLRSRVVTCDTCHVFDEQSPCRFCRDEQRDKTTICVVAEAPDVLAVEQTGVFRGRYHVLGGTVSPADGRGPDDLTIKHLHERLVSDGIQEVILALNSDIEGETTALYLKKALKDVNAKVTQLARGIPTGGDVTYMDEATLGEALSHRQTV